MPHRRIIAEELAALLGVLSHPDRIRIIQELSHEEAEVSHLRQVTGIPASRLSQHLGLLRGQHILRERREGRKVLYRLENPALYAWLVAGTELLQKDRERIEALMGALEKARTG